MNPYQLILKKRNKGEHTEAEIRHLVQEFVAERVESYQMAAWLMAVWFNGMTEAELTHLTHAMMESGDQVDLSSIEGVKVDKHSTGGVGDTTTLVLAPLVAAAGAKVAKMSGRGLGHTGGTLDKMESVPGLTVDLSAERFLDQVRRIGIAVISQTGNLVPADGKMYALRDVTATVDSIPLIASSIMSKKLACGAEVVLLDVKHGRGAFMEKLDDARALARAMVKLGVSLGRKVRAVLTDMDQPLGSGIGNALEVAEAIQVLRGEQQGTPLEEVSVELASHLVQMAGLAPDLHAARSRITSLLRSGAGLQKLAEMLEAQGGDPKVVDDPSRLPTAPIQEDFPAPEAGYLEDLHAQEVGHAAVALGAGRKKKGDPVDPAVGLVLKCRVGDRLEKGQPMATIHARTAEGVEEARRILQRIACISPEPPPSRRLIEEVVE